MSKHPLIAAVALTAALLLSPAAGLVHAGDGPAPHAHAAPARKWVFDPPAPLRENDYDRGRAWALTTQRPLVVFAGIAAPRWPYETWVSAEVPAGWQWTRGQTIVVSVYRNGDLEWVADLPGTATRAEIEATIRRGPRAIFAPAFAPAFTPATPMNFTAPAWQVPVVPFVPPARSASFRAAANC